MKAVYKYPIHEIHEYATIRMPENAEILSVQNQREVICIWALVELDTKTKEIPMIPRTFRIAQTGAHISESNLMFVGTVQLDMGYEVYHIFEVIS